jgi:hypothetical protein
VLGAASRGCAVAVAGSRVAILLERAARSITLGSVDVVMHKCGSAGNPRRNATVAKRLSIEYYTCNTQVPRRFAMRMALLSDIDLRRLMRFDARGSTIASRTDEDRSPVFNGRTSVRSRFWMGRSKSVRRYASTRFESYLNPISRSVNCSPVPTRGWRSILDRYSARQSPCIGIM